MRCVAVALGLSLASPAWAACSWSPGPTAPIDMVRCLQDGVTAFEAWLACDGEVGPADHCYTVIEGAFGFYDAQAACRDWGGHLATLSSDEENDFVFAISGGSGWIGHMDTQFEGTWLATTGEVAVIDEDTVYQAWGDGEPNDAGGEDCASMRDDSRWNDAPCDATSRALCERDF